MHALLLLFVWLKPRGLTWVPAMISSVQSWRQTWPTPYYFFYLCVLRPQSWTIVLGAVHSILYRFRHHQAELSPWGIWRVGIWIDSLSLMYIVLFADWLHVGYAAMNHSLMVPFYTHIATFMPSHFTDYRFIHLWTGMWLLTMRHNVTQEFRRSEDKYHRQTKLRWGKQNVTFQIGIWPGLWVRDTPRNFSRYAQLNLLASILQLSLPPFSRMSPPCGHSLQLPICLEGLEAVTAWVLGRGDRGYCKWS